MRGLISRVEAWQVRRFGRSVLGVLFRTDVLVLRVRGRRSGVLRSAPLACVAHDGGWLVAGGAGGRSRVDWVANLRAAGAAEVVVHRRSVPVSVSERPDLHDLAVARWPRLSSYERRSGRRAPVFVLLPLG